MNKREFDQDIKRYIDEFGLVVLGVAAGLEKSTFCYTIGLTEKFGHELIVNGLPMQVAGHIFNAIAKKDVFPDFDVPTDEFTNVPVMFKRCTLDLQDLHNEYICQADRYYGRDVEVVQMVLSDRNGRLPGHVEFDQAHMGSLQRLFCAPPLLC